VTEDTAIEDGQRQISVRVADPAWVRALVLGSAGQVELLSPEWLAESVANEAAAAIDAYAAF
jgi:proteasome accessory factor C